MKNQRFIDAAAEAYREISALERAVAEDGETEGRRAALALARLAFRAARGRLNGTQLAALRRAVETPLTRPTE